MSACRRRGRNGSVMIQMMITMLVVSLFFPLMIQMTKIVMKSERFPVEIQDQIALTQLRRFMNSCKITAVLSDELICETDRLWHLRTSTSNLYLSDGTIIVLADVSEVQFEKRNRQIWMLYQRKNQWKEALIACD